MDSPRRGPFKMANYSPDVSLQSEDSFESSGGSHLSGNSNGSTITVSGRLPVSAKSQIVFVRDRGGSNMGPTCLDLRTCSSPLSGPSSAHPWIGSPPSASADGSESEAGVSFSIDARVDFTSPSRSPGVSRFSPTAGTAIACQNGQISLSPVYRRPTQSANFSFVVNTETPDSGICSRSATVPTTPESMTRLASREPEIMGANVAVNEMPADLTALLEKADVTACVRQVVCAEMVALVQALESTEESEGDDQDGSVSEVSDKGFEVLQATVSKSKTNLKSELVSQQTLRIVASNDEDSSAATLADIVASPLPRDEGGNYDSSTSTSEEEELPMEEELANRSSDSDVSDQDSTSEGYADITHSRSSGGFSKEQLSSCSKPIKKKKKKPPPPPPPPPPELPPLDCSCPPPKPPCQPLEVTCLPPVPCDPCDPSPPDDEEKFTPATKTYFQAKYALQQLASLKRENMYLKEEVDEWNDAMRADGWDDMVFIRMKGKNRSAFPRAPPKEALGPDTVPAMSYKTVLNLAAAAKLEQEIENRKLTKAIAQSQMESLKRRKERRQNDIPLLEDAYEYYFDAQINGRRQMKEIEEEFMDLEKKFVEAVKLLQKIPKKWEDKKELKEALELLKDFLRSGAPLDATTLPMLEILNPYLQDTKLLNMLFKRIDHSDIPGRDKPWSPYERGLSARGPRRLVARRETEKAVTVPFLQKEWQKASMRAAVQITDGLADIQDLTKKIKTLTAEDCHVKNFKETFKNTIVSK